MGRNHRNAAKAAILASIERSLASPAAWTECSLLSKTLRVKAVLDRGDGMSPALRAEFLNGLLTQYTNGAAPQPEKPCTSTLLRCKNLTHLHQILDFETFLGTSPSLRLRRVSCQDQTPLAAGSSRLEFQPER